MWLKFKKLMWKILKRRTATNGISSALQFCWRFFLKGWKRSFFSKKILIYFFDFFCQKNSIKEQKTFLRNNIICYAFSSKFATISDFEDHLFFGKKSFVLGNYTFSVAFYGNFALIWWWKILKFRNVRTFGNRHFQLASKHTKRSDLSVKVDHFPSII